MDGTTVLRKVKEKFNFEGNTVKAASSARRAAGTVLNIAGAQTKSTASKMEQLSGVMIIIIIGGGVLTFVMLFIFAKRQIMRFTLRSRRGPHVPVGNDARKNLRREIERRLDCIQKIQQEPKLLWNDDKYIMKPEQPLPPYYYRMQAVDDVKLLEKEIARADGSVRHPYDNLRAFLLTTLSVTLNGASQRLIHQFCDMYEHARHDPNEFDREEYEAYQRLLLKLLDAAKQLKTFANSRKSSPARTPKKQTKMHSLLDPARLRPPPITTTHDGSNIIGGESVGGIMHMPPTSELTAGQHSKVNLTLGLQGHDLGNTDIPTNPLHLHQTPAERDIIIRNRIKTPTLDDVEHISHMTTDHHSHDHTTSINHADEDEDDNEIMSISSVQFHNNSSVV